MRRIIRRGTMNGALIRRRPRGAAGRGRAWARAWERRPPARGDGGERRPPARGNPPQSPPAGLKGGGISGDFRHWDGSSICMVTLSPLEAAFAQGLIRLQLIAPPDAEVPLPAAGRRG